MFSEGFQVEVDVFNVFFCFFNVFWFSSVNKLDVPTPRLVGETRGSKLLNAASVVG